MFWECTVCTNHFSGPSPPDACSSCGSPRERFTAYHYYGLATPTESPDSGSPIRRPSYTETLLQAASCLRFHKTKYFHADPMEFYRNFLETRRTFKARNRFAGAGFNSGFYFATTVESAIAEKVFWDGISEDGDLQDPQAVLRQLGSRGDDYVFLQVALPSLERLADLTDPIVLEYFLREGPARAEFQPSGVPYALLRAITPSGKGGSRHTDGIGYHASSNGWNAVRFPSVRALQQAWGLKDLTRMDILNRVAQDHPRAVEDSVDDQLRNQAILVIFSGSLLTRSISEYTWMRADGTTESATNPHYGVDAQELEEVRLAFRKDNALIPEQAADLGYLSDEEIENEFTTDVWWVSAKEKL